MTIGRREFLAGTAILVLSTMKSRAMIIRERHPHLPVVLTSGYSSVLAENAHHGFELIQKPYSVENRPTSSLSSTTRMRWPRPLMAASRLPALIPA